MSPFLRPGLAGLRATLEGKREEALALAEKTFAQFPDPEMVYLTSRHLAYLGMGERAVHELNRVLDGGYVFYRQLTGPDTWFDPIREREDFQGLLARARSKYHEAREAYRDAGGE